MSQFETASETEARTGPAQQSQTNDEHGFSDELLPCAVEAVLLASDKPLAPSRIAQAVGLDEGGSQRVKEAVESLNASYKKEGRSFRIEPVAGGLRVMTLPEFATAVAAIRGMRDSGRLSKAAIETLSIIAYRQPITRAELEGIRGVSCGEVVRTLLDRRLVEITGRAEELGRPMLYGTTKRFLEAFGLANLKELPPVEEFDSGAAMRSLSEVDDEPRSSHDVPAQEESAQDAPAEEAPAEAEPDEGAIKAKPEQDSKAATD